MIEASRVSEKVRFGLVSFSSARISSQEKMGTAGDDWKSFGCLSIRARPALRIVAFSSRSKRKLEIMIFASSSASSGCRVFGFRPVLKGTATALVFRMP